jgi:lysozyme
VILGCDLSHHQGSPDFAQVRAAGRQFVVLKATEGTTWRDPECAASRGRAHAAGLVVGLYHFARAGDPVEEAAWFATATGPLAPGEFAVLDWEVDGEPVGWAARWLGAVRDRLGVRALVYLNRSLRDGHDWSPVVAAGSGLWLACHDGTTDPVAAGAWPLLAMKQYSATGTVPGLAGPVDLDVFYGDADALRGCGSRG